MAEKKKTVLKPGMYECKMKDGEEIVIYHSSTAETLQEKGWLTVGKHLKNYKPKAAK